MQNQNNGSNSYDGFTIVELIVVIVVTAILSALIIVAYVGLTVQANEASVISDLVIAKKQLNIYSTKYGSYPTSMSGNCPTTPVNDVDYCLKPSPGNTFTYNYNQYIPSIYHLTSTRGNTSFSVNNSVSPAPATTVTGSAIGKACPTGFIPVPGSGTYNTNDFCVMKYEAKQANATTPISTASGLPWTSISQTDVINYSRNVVGCSGCHLISEAEWMTIAQNIISVPSNWSGGDVGNGHLQVGNSDSSPANTLEVTNINDPYNGTNDSAISAYPHQYQRRTLTLTNSEVVWDMSGNAWEWTSGQVSSGQPGVASGVYEYNNWLNITVPGNMPIDPTPVGTGVVTINGNPGPKLWLSESNGIGKVFSKSEETETHAVLRGGHYNSSDSTGILYVWLAELTSSTGFGIGFRVTQ